jgi:YVTN family beta-propeller protein
MRALFVGIVGLTMCVAVVGATGSVADAVSGSPSPGDSLVYVGTQNNGVDIVDLTTNQLVGNVPLPASPDNGTGSVAISSDGKTVFAADHANNTISVISTASETVTATVHTCTYPNGMVVSPDNTTLYFTCKHATGQSGKGLVEAMNTQTYQFQTIVKDGSVPYELTLSPDGSNLYVANLAGRIVTNVNIPSKSSQKINIARRSDDIALCPPSFNRAIASSNHSSKVSFIDTTTNQQVSAVQIAGSAVAVATTNSGNAYIPVTGQTVSTAGVAEISCSGVVGPVIPLGSGGDPDAVTYDALTNEVLVSNFSPWTLSVIDPRTNTVSTTIPVDANPHAIAPDPVPYG